MQYSVLGVREFHYVHNQPIVARYILSDKGLLNELDERFDFPAKTDAIVGATPALLHEYEHVLRFRDTRIYHREYQQAARKIKEGITELVALRLLEGQDNYIIREDTLSNLDKGDTWQ